MVRYVYSMQLPAALTHLSSKTKPPDPVLGIGRSPKKYTFSVSSLLSKHGRPGRFHPNPQPRSFLGTSPPQPWVVSPVGFRGRSYSHSLRRPPEVRNWGTGKPRLRTALRIVIEFGHAMRIFVSGAGATGSLLAQLLERQGHTVWCGDRDPERARRFLGKRSTIAVTEVNARNLRGIVKAAKGCQLIVNSSASVFNEIVLRAALRLRAYYVDLSSHLTRHPFKAEQFRYAKKFEEKNRVALINAGVAPGLTNLLVKRAAGLLDEVEAVHIRLYESSESEDPISQWSPEVSFDEAVSHPRV